MTTEAFPDIGLDAIRAELRAIDAGARARLRTADAGGAPALRRLLDWIENRERRFAQLEQELARTPEDVELVSQWLHDAPRPDAGTAANDAPDALLTRAAALESQLFGLVGALLQHSGSPRVRDLYRDLLDHALPARRGAP